MERIKLKSLTVSYNLVQLEPTDAIIKLSQYVFKADSGEFNWNRSFSCLTVCSPVELKQGNEEPQTLSSIRQLHYLQWFCLLFCISSTMAEFILVSHNMFKYTQIYPLIILSLCFLATSNPLQNNFLYSKKALLSRPPITSTYSNGNLKGAASNPRLPGEFDNMNPKSIWIKWPSLSNSMFPLCRSFIWSRYVTIE